MKVLIRKRFRDADTLQMMIPGAHAEYDEARARRLSRSGFVVLIDADCTVFEKAEAPMPEYPDDAEKSAPEGDEGSEKNETAIPSKQETTGIPGKRGRKPKK